MTTGLMGSGTSSSPWLIETKAQMAAVLRDVTSSGYYFLVRDIEPEGAIYLNDLTGTQSSGYAAKVIDLDGRTVRFDFSRTDYTTSTYFLSTIHFRVGSLVCMLRASTTTSYVGFVFHRCALDDCAVYLRKDWTGSSVCLITSPAGTPSLIPGVLRRAVFLNADIPTAALSGFLLHEAFNTLGGLTVSASYVSGTAGFNGVQPISNPSLAALDGGGSAFTSAGWVQDGAFMYSVGAESISLQVTTALDGAGIARRVWVESQSRIVFIGETDNSGSGLFVARVKKRESFSAVAAEDVGVSELMAGLYVTAGSYYLSPNYNGYVYQASASGWVVQISGVVFGSQPVIVGDITFTPRPRFPSATSARTSLAYGGPAQTINLDTSGSGGGPVITGEPAYLDGIIEEVHPFLGTTRLLANSEVLAFELRGVDYVPMGRAYSNALGEFRVNTEVYGGGDIFAFATDFPGVIWQAGIELNTGDRVRPTVNNGYVYEVITPGNSGATEPQWWADTGDGTEGAIGGATAKARPYYQPVGHGPLKMTLVE